MEKLTDYKPLKSVKLPGLEGELDCSGLILIVGPNSSGKTQFLQDLKSSISGEVRTWVVAEKIVINKPLEYKVFEDCLVNEGYISRDVDEAGIQQLRGMTSHVGIGTGVPVVQANHAIAWYNQLTEEILSKGNIRVEFLAYFGPMLMASLFLERRLISVNEVGAFDYEKQGPQNDIQALYMNDNARLVLTEEVQNTFSKGMWLDNTRNVLCLRVNESRDIPSDKAMRSPTEMSKYRKIATEGDGFKSYLAISIAMLLARHPVCLVDEPEMCLHPPQAYSLGQFIGENGVSTETVTFVSTHSSQILRGIIQTAEKPQVVRLTRKDGKFNAHLVAPDILKKAFKKPSLRTETIIDGIFSQSVVVIEGDGDRIVYRAVAETLGQDFDRDIHFAAVGGTGGIADACNLYRTMNIPVAVVVDIDIIDDRLKLERILKELADDGIARDLSRRAFNIARQIKVIPPGITVEEVRKCLQKAIDDTKEWSDGHDEKLRGTLNSISRELSRMKRLKRKGLEAVDNADLKERLSALIAECKEHGLFVVPVGELEGWLSGCGISVSEKKKWAWANEAASVIVEEGRQKGDIWGFVEDIADYLKASL